MTNNKDSPSNKLLYAREIPGYRQEVERWVCVYIIFTHLILQELRWVLSHGFSFVVFYFFSGQKVVWHFWSNHKGRHFLLLFLGFILTYKQLAHSLHRNYPSSWMTCQRLVFSTARFTCHVFYLGWTNLLITGGMCKATPPLSRFYFLNGGGGCTEAIQSMDECAMWKKFKCS